MKISLLLAKWGKKQNNREMQTGQQVGKKQKCKNEDESPSIFFSIAFLSTVKYKTIWRFTERLLCPCRALTHGNHFILQAQPKGMWGWEGSGCFSCSAQAAAGSHLLTTFCYLQAAVTDFRFQHLALLLFGGCLVPKGKLWWLVRGGTAAYEPASRSIPVPPFIPTHTGLSLPYGLLASVCSPQHMHGTMCAEFSVLSAMPATPGHAGIKSSFCLWHCLPSPFPGVLWDSRETAQDARGSPSWGGAKLPFSSPATRAMEGAVM